MRRFLYGLAALVLLAGRVEQAKADYIFTTLDGSAADGINDSGQIVGERARDGFLPEGFLYSGGSYTPINVPGSPSLNSITIPCGINNAGQVVGSYEIDRAYFGFQLSGGHYTTFSAPGDNHLTGATGINDLAQVVGIYRDNQGIDHGFLLSNGAYTRIDVPGPAGTLTSVNGINNLGQMVGSYGVDFSSQRGFLLSNGNYTTLDVPGSGITAPQGINNAGAIVGDFLDSQGFHGFVLSGGIFSTVDVPGALSMDVSGINDTGEIVGEFIDANGNQHGYLATPVPEPFGILLFFVGALCLLSCQRVKLLHVPAGGTRRSKNPPTPQLRQGVGLPSRLYLAQFVWGRAVTP